MTGPEVNMRDFAIILQPHGCLIPVEKVLTSQVRSRSRAHAADSWRGSPRLDAARSEGSSGLSWRQGAVLVEM